MFYTYILKSLKNGKFYIGYTGNLLKRLERHNAGYANYTKNRGPFKMVYSETFATRIEAIKREKQIKNYKGGDEFKKLI
ncbi:GIY-YIG nuclease family protein [Candidatus Wolfebacteria bacterium]|nr:GIY-YIG nuclease family protein [Candidatus Wolfebacteria bacterium]